MPLSTNLKCLLFADDNTTLTSGSDIIEVGNFVNYELQKLGQWLRSNELATNTQKTKIIIFSNKKTVPDFPFVLNQNDVECSISDSSLISPIERITNKSKTPFIKLLGVHFDENLTFEFHVDKVCKKINSALYYINAVKHFLSSKSLLKLYYALIHSHFVYCLPVYSFTNSKNINILVVKQKRCMRIITKSRYNAHTEPLFFNLKVLPLNDLITYHKLIFMHSLAHQYCAVHYPHFITNYELNLHRFELRNDKDFFVYRNNSALIKRMPLIDFPSAWNDLDTELKEIASKPLFKKIIKLNFLDKYSNFTCQNTLCLSCMNI